MGLLTGQEMADYMDEASVKTKSMEGLTGLIGFVRWDDSFIDRDSKEPRHFDDECLQLTSGIVSHMTEKHLYLSQDDLLDGRYRHNCATPFIMMLDAIIVQIKDGSPMRCFTLMREGKLDRDIFKEVEKCLSES